MYSAAKFEQKEIPESLPPGAFALRLDLIYFFAYGNYSICVFSLQYAILLDSSDILG